MEYELILIGNAFVNTFVYHSYLGLIGLNMGAIGNNYTLVSWQIKIPGG